MELIPAIDIIDGQCVRLSKGDFNEKIIYHNNPVVVARNFETAGIKRLHIVDLDGARGRSLKNIKVLEEIAAVTSLAIDFGGGLKTTDHVRSVFDAGAAMVSIGSIVVKSPELLGGWISDFGADKFFPGADVLERSIKIHGWKEDTGIEIFDFIRTLLKLGITQVFCTDIAKDGMLQGPATGLYREILAEFAALQLVASGGISCYEDMIALQAAGCSGAIIGKAFYEGKITMVQIQEFSKL